MAELFSILNHQIATLPAPLVIAESDGDVTVVSLAATGFEAGSVVSITIDMVSAFTSAGDQLNFRTEGDVVSSTFLKESKDANEVVPFSFTFTLVTIGTTVDLQLIAFIDGGGNPDVTIDKSTIAAVRVG